MLVDLMINGEFGATDRHDDLLVIGRPVRHDQSLSASQLHAEIVSIATLDSNDILPGLGRVLSRLDGFFSFIWRTPDAVYLCADRARSRPLFYQFVRRAGWRITDRVETLQLGGRDSLSEEEFRRAGYVTGSSTLDRAVTQLEAGTIIALTSDGGTRTHRYHDYFSRSIDPANRTKAQLLEALDATVLPLIDSIIRYAGGRQLVIPLSGGADSRALAACLAARGYQNLLAFTFGARRSPEVETSRRVATALGIPWQAVRYDRSTWQQMLPERAFTDYLRRAHSLVSVPNLQVYPAVPRLLAAGLIQSSAVILPGHTDFFPGGSMPPMARLAPNQRFDVESADQFIWKTRYLYRSAETGVTDLVRKKLEGQVAELWQRAPGSENSPERWLATIDAWNHRERQAKFIGNSNRYYEAFGLEWWMPLWQEAFANFWREVPLSYRAGKQLWCEWIDRQMRSVSPVSAPIPYITGPRSSFTRYLATATEYLTEPNAMFSTVPFRRWFTYRYLRSSQDGSVFGTLIDRTLQQNSWIEA